MKLKPIILILLTLLVAVSVSSTGVWAANHPKKKTPRKEMTDAAGRVHVRPSGRITDAQRKAAARRRAAHVRRAREGRPVKLDTIPAGEVK